MTAEGRRRALIAWVATVAFAAFCAFHWANLLKAPPVGKVLLIVAIAAALGLGLLTIAARAQTPGRARAGAAALTLVAVVAGLLAAGIELRLLAPAHWDALGGGIGDGIAGLGGATYPYDEGARWANLVLLAALPVILVAAFAFCFWPVRKARWTRGVGLGILVGAYGVASVLYAPGLPLLHGILLLALLAACLWAPELRTSRLALAAGAVALAALVAVPVAGALDRERPVVDYRSWDWTGGEPSVGFAWNHAYGPLDWPREGTALLEVRSPEAHYWRSIVLERFDGFRWVRSDIASRPMELPNLIEGSEGGDLRDDWYEKTEVTVRELRSGLVVSPGSPQSVGGVEETIAGDGTTLAGELPASGQSYEVVSYAPDPSTEELESAPGEYDPALARFTQLDLPTSRVELPGNLDLPQLETGATNLITETLHVPLWGEPSPAVAVAARESGYGGVYALAQRLRRESSTPYEFVRAVERHLGQGFSYSESPTQSRRPLRSFLFSERTGYCQQFSGAMALILRMAGIPTRVVSGFSPGAPDLDEDGVFVVRDTDAHSWVETYFSGIGWVPFDPTPSASPANFQSASTAAAATPAAISEQPGAREREPAISDDAGGAPGASDEAGSPWPGIVLLLLAVALGGLGASATVRRRRFQRLRPQERLAAQAAELAAAAGVARYRPEPGQTLLQLERRLRAGGRTRAAGYAARLGDSRFGARRPRAPDLDERRSVRRDLARSQGLRVRLRMLAAIPPGAPDRG